MQIGSKVYVIGGTHKGLKGKIVALSDPKASIKHYK